MGVRAALSVFLAGCAAALGCTASIQITKPVNGSSVTMPQEVLVTQSGAVTFGDVMLDGFNMSNYNGQHWQYAPGATLYCVPEGPQVHTLHVSAEDSKLHTNISEGSTFTVSSCPLCYSCPVGQLHPATGQCCDGGKCDEWAAANFGPVFYGQTDCRKQTFPTPNTSIYYYELDCISPQAAPLRGGSAPEMSAVSFVARVGGLAQIQAPLGWVSGVNGVRVWITEDAGGSPGAVLEAITVNNLRPQPTTTSVVAPIHIFSATHPQLTAGTKYWLVIGPADASTRVWWNKTINGDDSSIPNTTTYKLSTNIADPSGPWVAKSNLVELRPAFEIDVRQ